MKCIICGKPSAPGEIEWIAVSGVGDICSPDCYSIYINRDRITLPKNDICDYEAKGRAIGRLVDSKQKQYGDSFHKCGSYLRLLYPDGIRPEQYDDLLTVVRDFDKSMRIATGNQGNEDAWADKCGYALLAMKDVVA